MKKRRLLSIVISLCMVLALMPQMVFAETSGTTKDGFSYTISDANEVTITGYNGTATTVEIPAAIEDKTVTSIGQDAFISKSNIESVTIPNSVTSIGIGAFKSCTSLKSINIPDGVTSIGRSVFYQCRNLTTVTFGDKSQLTSIGYGAFSSCESLASINIPDGVTSIGEEAFYLCKSLASIDIPDGVTTIGKSAFGGCSRLANVRFGDNSQLESIGVYAFSSCESLASIEIPSSVRSIANQAFEECKNLTTVTFGDNSELESIGVYAFCNCQKLKSIEIPYSVSSIGEGAFCELSDGCYAQLDIIFLPDKQDLSVGSHILFDTMTQVKYSLDTEKDEVTITNITLGTGKTDVAIPDTICGYPVVAVAASEQSKVGAHKCNSRAVIMSEALKTAGTCQSEAVYYYSCGICGKVYPDDNTTFNGEKDSSNHTGGTEIREAKDATCTEVGYTGDTYCKGCGAILSQGSSENKLKHDLVKTPAKEATAAETGNKVYWQCKDCNKYFSDEDGTNEITDLESWKAGEGQIDKLSPEIIKAMDQSVTEGEEKALSFTSNAAFSDFIRVDLDGSELSEEYYEKAEGSIIITLDADYVATLPVGEHTIGIVSESGTATTTFTVEEKVTAEDSAKTGDDTNLALWLALMLLSGVGITGVTAYTRRKRTNE